MYQSKPEWLKIKPQGGKNRTEVENILAKLSLHTVCEEANCPNLMECFNRRTATFMILGSVCTRNCTFCNVQKGSAQQVDLGEPLHVAQAVKELDLKHVVITSVTRDDLADGGASHFAAVVCATRDINPRVVIEVLIPDFQGNEDALQEVVKAKPEIINHNVETIPRLYSTVRPMAAYRRSLELIGRIKTMDSSILTKSGIMVGLGEQYDEVIKLFGDLRDVNCDILTIGQYLSPSKKHHPVVEYIHPNVFKNYEIIALDLGFKYVASGPLVRSSYLADKALDSTQRFI